MKRWTTAYHYPRSIGTEPRIVGRPDRCRCDGAARLTPRCRSRSSL